MARSFVEVVAISDPDSPSYERRVRELTSLWLAQRVDHGVTPEAAARAAAEGRLADALGRDGTRAWLALLDGMPVGYVITTTNPFGISPAPELAIEQLFVDARARRHGVARALMRAVVTHAERIGSELVVSHTPSQNREANRFFARLGFAPIVVRRAVSTAALRRRVDPAAATSTQLVLRRRRTVVGSLRAPTRHTA